MVRSPSARIRVSSRTETCTTSDTPLPTWYRTIKLTCRGRPQNLQAVRNRDGGPGQVHRRVRRSCGPCQGGPGETGYVWRSLRRLGAGRPGRGRRDGIRELLDERGRDNV